MSIDVIIKMETLKIEIDATLADYSSGAVVGLISRITRDVHQDLSDIIPILEHFKSGLFKLGAKENAAIVEAEIVRRSTKDTSSSSWHIPVAIVAASAMAGGAYAYVKFNRN